MSGTQIFSDNGFVNFSNGELISSQELLDTPFDEGSVWEALESGEVVSLSDGDFFVNEDMRLKVVETA